MEIWKKIPGFDYEVSSLGNIRSMARKVRTKGGALRSVRTSIVAQGRLLTGYRQVCLHKAGSRFRFMVHRLVLTVFVGEPPTADHQGNHKNGVKNDNRLENLEWVTGTENMQHALKFLNWRHYSGENNPASKLSNKDVEEIRRLKGKVHQSQLASMFGVSQVHISRIHRGVKRKEG